MAAADPPGHLLAAILGEGKGSATMTFAGAAAVALVGVLGGCLALLQPSVGAGLGLVIPTAPEVGGALFEALRSDLVQVAAPPAAFRFTVPAAGDESRASRFAWAVLVGAAAISGPWRRAAGWTADDITVTLSVQAASYLLRVPLPFGGLLGRAFAACGGVATVALSLELGLVLEALQAVFCLAATFAGLRLRGALGAAAGLALAAVFLALLAEPVAKYLMPVVEFGNAFDAVSTFVGRERLRRLATTLLCTTAQLQVTCGFLGIAFLRRAQERQNRLLTVGAGDSTARGFVRHVVFFILAVAAPYLLQRTVYEGINQYAYGVFARDCEQSLRIDSFLPPAAQGEGEGALMSAAASTNLTVGAHASAINDVIDSSYHTIARKIFSLPKLVLLPSMMWHKPMLVVTVLPISIAIDIAKSHLVALVSDRIEEFNRQIQEFASRRTQIEQHDSKHEELIRRGLATPFARSQWQNVSRTLADLQLRHDALDSVRGFVEWLYWQDFMIPGIECALGFLLEARLISNVEIWIYTRVVEDAIDMLLARSRMQSQLATMETNVGRLRDLAESLNATRSRGRPTCEVDPAGAALRLRDVGYSRGASTRVRIPALELHTGRVYAVTGGNGCGKSTLFALLAGCGRQAIALPPGTELDPESRFVLPSREVVEVTQTLYCPLFTRPIAWMLQRPDVDAIPAAVLRDYEERIVRLLEDLGYRQDGPLAGTSASDSNASSSSSSSGGAATGAGLSKEELHAEQDDWYGSMSGGQRAKVEFVRKVFLQESCPRVLLLDEAFAALDQLSKAAVQRKLKAFCTGSLVVAIYHTDAAGFTPGSGSAGVCASGGGFFDEHIHFENGTATIAGTC